MKQKNVWLGIAAGACGGLVASFAMNQFQSLLSEASKAVSSDQEKQQSEQQQQQQSESSESSDNATVMAAKAISSTVFNHELTGEEKQWAGPAVHYGLGTTLGAVYGVLAEVLPGSTVGAGTLYGTAVWLVADEIAVPAFGLSQPPTETPASSHLTAWASHLVFGLVTDLTRRLVMRGRE